MEIKEITKDDLSTRYRGYMTIGDLKEFLNKHNLPDNGKILVQRVEDRYYENHNWGVYLKDGEHTFKDEHGNIVKETLEQYTPAWCCVKYKDEDMLFIDLHY